MGIFEYNQDELLGTVESVDTSTAIIKVENDDKLRGLQVNHLVTIQSSKVGQHLIGLVSKIIRKSGFTDSAEDLTPDLSFNVIKAFPHFGQSGKALPCIPCRRLCRIRSVQCCHTKILQEVSYGILPIDQLLEDDLLCTIADAVHGSDPCYLVLRFQLLIDTLFLCQLCYEQMEFVSCLSVNISQIAVQFSAENKVGIEHGTMLF